jgi:threonine/homoserine/homoserine lactone efflux protein
MSSAIAYSVIKYLGAVYLIYLSVQIRLRQKQPPSAQVLLAQPLSQVLGQAVLADVLNPKAALFFLTFLPQFTDPMSGMMAQQMVVLGIFYSLIAVSWYSLLALLASVIRQRFSSIHSGFSQWQQWITGSVFVGLGIRVVLPEKNVR